MLRAALALMLSLTFLTAGTCAEPQAQPLEAAANDMPPHTLQAVCAAAHAGVVLMDDATQATVLDDKGCYVWQQPGAALVISSVWTAGEGPSSWFGAEDTMNMLRLLPELTVDEPVVYPTEPDDVDGFYLEPRVYVLGADAAQRRLARFNEGLEMWVSFNEGAGFIVPDAEDLESDIAIVYLDSGGPLEFHFQVGESGKLVLRHVINFDFFSA